MPALRVRAADPAVLCQARRAGRRADRKHAEQRNRPRNPVGVDRYFRLCLAGRKRRCLAPPAERSSRRARQQRAQRFFMARVRAAARCRARRTRARAALKNGAVGAVVATHVEAANLGELPLDEYWAAAQSLDVPVFLHPAQPAPLPRTSKFALNQIVQYTFDTTLCVGSVISSGVLDRFPKLRLILSHGGGALPYLIGRFDIMHERADKSQGIVAAGKPSAYLHRLWYDSILHDAQALRYLASRVSVDRIVLGSDDSFPPADLDPLASLQAAGFDAAEVHTITEDNPRLLFRL